MRENLLMIIAVIQFITVIVTLLEKEAVRRLLIKMLTKKRKGTKRRYPRKR